MVLGARSSTSHAVVAAAPRPPPSQTRTSTCFTSSVPTVPRAVAHLRSGLVPPSYWSIASSTNPVPRHTPSTNPRARFFPPTNGDPGRVLLVLVGLRRFAVSSRHGHGGDARGLVGGGRAAEAQPRGGDPRTHRPMDRRGANGGGDGRGSASQPTPTCACQGWRRRTEARTQRR